jgi:hypothetical protein
VHKNAEISAIHTVSDEKPESALLANQSDLPESRPQKSVRSSACMVGSSFSDNDNSYFIIDPEVKIPENMPISLKPQLWQLYYQNHWKMTRFISSSKKNIARIAFHYSHIDKDKIESSSQIKVKIIDSFQVVMEKGLP